MRRVLFSFISYDPIVRIVTRKPALMMIRDLRIFLFYHICKRHHVI